MSKKEGRKTFERRRKETLKCQREERHLGVTKNKREDKQVGAFLPGSVFLKERSNFSSSQVSKLLLRLKKKKEEGRKETPPSNKRPFATF